MDPYRSPDWQAPFTLGMWQICYRIDGNRYLTLFRGGGRQASNNPAREWGMAVMCGQDRDSAAEQRVRSIPELTGRCHPRDVDGTEVLMLLEKDIDFVVERVREAFHDASLAAGH